MVSGEKMRMPVAEFYSSCVRRQFVLKLFYSCLQRIPMKEPLLSVLRIWIRSDPKLFTYQDSDPDPK